MIVGSATRYLAGRGAVQTVYWIGDGSGGKMVKYSRVLTFRDKNAAAENISLNGSQYSQRMQSPPPSAAQQVPDRRYFHTTTPLMS
ncbi:uncharacterized protein LOC110833169 [Zootermopsis nevadensis]|uniref:uncharacterized protein LOC110833169 n=1 Tax=Zootermopsis nevadensis TaxID=136037 RepID=UPI000B8E4AA8|nr:uncharacterized protein LOC110833169 [Zootermopsis nevadensis]